jgi:hypothetical protein
VNGLRVGHFCRRNDGRHVQVTEGRGGRANAHRLFGQLHIFGFTIGFGIHHHRFHTQLFTRTLNSQRNFAAVGNQDFFKHALALLDVEQGLTVFHGLAVVDQDAGDGAAFVCLNFIQNLHGFDDANGFTLFHHSAHLDKGLSLWAG